MQSFINRINLMYIVSAEITQHFFIFIDIIIILILIFVLH